MDAYEYKQVILEEVRAHARADALLVADLGDVPPGNEANTAQVYEHYRTLVDGIVSRYTRGSIPATALIEEMTDAYCVAFKEGLESTWMKGRVPQ